MKEKTENEFRQLLFKAERFCAYRERCSYEVKQKLYIKRDKFPHLLSPPAPLSDKVRSPYYIGSKGTRFVSAFTNNKFPS